MNNCQNCKFNASEGCGVNPAYWELSDLIGDRSPLSIKQQGAVKYLFTQQYLDGCPDWEVEKSVILEITLTEKEWKEVADYQHRTAGFATKIQNQAIAAGFGSKPKQGAEPLPLEGTITARIVYTSNIPTQWENLPRYQPTVSIDPRRFR